MFGHSLGSILAFELAWRLDGTPPEVLADSGAGVGWADAQILVTAVTAGARLHSTDRAMRKVCRSVAVVLA